MDGQLFDLLLIIQVHKHDKIVYLVLKKKEQSFWHTLIMCVFTIFVGAWLMHCHLDVHIGWGLATVLLVENGVGKLQSIEPPPVDLPLC